MNGHFRLVPSVASMQYFDDKPKILVYSLQLLETVLSIFEDLIQN